MQIYKKIYIYVINVINEELNLHKSENKDNGN